MLSFSHEVFFQVSKNLSFSKAAESLYITQPAISKHIKGLEQQYNSNLFERKGNSILLTKEGQLLFDYLKKAKQVQKQLEFDITSLKDKTKAKSSLAIGACTTVALYVIPGTLSAFHREFPLINLRLVNRNSDNIFKALLAHEIDLGIIEETEKVTSVKYKFFMKDEVVPVCSYKSPFAKRKKIEINELINIPIALREQGSGTLAAVIEALGKSKIKISDLTSKIILGGTEALKNFLIDDTAIGFLPLHSVSKQVKSGELVRLNIPRLHITRDFYFIQRQGNETDKMNNMFIKMALDHYNQK